MAVVSMFLDIVACCRLLFPFNHVSSYYYLALSFSRLLVPWYQMAPLMVMGSTGLIIELNSATGSPDGQKQS